MHVLSRMFVSEDFGVRVSCLRLLAAEHAGLSSRRHAVVSRTDLLRRSLLVRSGPLVVARVSCLYTPEALVWARALSPYSKSL